MAKYAALAELMRITTRTLEQKALFDRRQVRIETTKAVARKLFDRTEREMVRALLPVFQAQVASAVKGLAMAAKTNGGWVKGYNPNQPREPAGTSTGGQFASEGGNPAATLATTQSSWQDRYPPSAEDPPPGGKWEYHNTKAGSLAGIAASGLKASPASGLSTTPHLEGAHFYGDIIDDSARGGPAKQAVLLRMSRDGLKVGYPDQDGTVRSKPTPKFDKDPTREHLVLQDVPAAKLEFYYKGKWHGLVGSEKGYNPNQPRVPAGSSEGGQFASNQTGTPEFKAWFKDSKVVDETGKPLVVYHGTSGDFASTFDPAKGELGIHFGTQGVASSFGERYNPAGAGNRVYPAYLSIQKPLRMQDLGNWSELQIMETLVAGGAATQEQADAWKAGYDARWKAHDWSKGGYPRQQETVKLLTEYGYDGIVYVNRREGMDLPKDLWESTAKLNKLTDEEFLQRVPNATTSYIAIRAEQIKSATANSGAFDPNDPDSTKGYNPNQPRIPAGSPEGGQFAGGQTSTPEFKAWFGDSKVVDADGRPLVVYHGTKHDFDEFRVGAEDGKDWGMLDRLLGPHFAEDPSVTDTFTTGQYSWPSDFVVSDQPGNSWYRQNGELKYDGIPVVVSEVDGREQIEIYDPATHGGTWGIRDRLGNGAHLRIAPPGGQVLPVYLSIKNPLVIEPHEREMDQSAVGRVVGSLVFPKDRQLFVDAVAGTGRSASVGEQMWDTLSRGETYSAGEYETYTSFEDVARNFTGLLHGPEKTNRARAALQAMGYDGIRYRNTSQNEVKKGSSPVTWIAFSATQIKSATANSGAFDPSNPDITKLYNPAQPRVAAGRPEGGQWAPADGGAPTVSVNDNPLPPLTRQEELQTLSYLRETMPQVRSPDKPEFFAWLTGQGITYRRVQRAAGDLRGMQADYNPEKVAQMTATLRSGGTLGNSPVLGSADGYIADGHHRWRAQYEYDPSSLVEVDEVDLPAQQLLDTIKLFPKHFIVGVDEPLRGKAYCKEFDIVQYDALELVRRIFRPQEWTGAIIDRALPVLARGMSEAAIAQLLTVGVDVRRKGYNPNQPREPAGTPTGGQFAGGQTNTPEFKAWFKDSKVVDENGKPLVVYHGTTADFSVFGNAGGRVQWDGGYSGRGFYFANANTASVYAGAGQFSREPAPEGAKLLPVYLSAQNPLQIQEVRGGPDQIVAVARAVGLDLPPEIDGINAKRLVPTISEDITKALEAKGHDGVIYTWSSGNVEYMVPKAEQIKSATGNQGTFDPNDPDITKRYNPTQPRDPAGTPTGGRWSAGSFFITEGEPGFAGYAVSGQDGKYLKADGVEEFFSHVRLGDKVAAVLDSTTVKGRIDSVVHYEGVTAVVIGREGWGFGGDLALHIETSHENTLTRASLAPVDGSDAAAVVHVKGLRLLAGRKGGVKSTASDWLERSGQELPPGIMVELPDWLKDEIADQLRTTFAQMYWRKIAENTRDDILGFLEEGLQDGWSIVRMAAEISGAFPESYCRSRATNVARTESGNALNGARRASMDALADELPADVSKYIRASWLSVLGTTTRPAHADLDGVPADNDGLFNLDGVRVPWPGHWSLPAKNRCNCQCTIISEFGMTEADAMLLIQEHADRVVAGKNYKAGRYTLKVWNKGYNPNQPRVPAGQPGGGRFASDAAFGAWFGDSKVVDENGKPLVVYHGTAGDFNEFKTGTHNAWSDALGFDTYFFSADRATASTYAGQFENGKVREAYLSIQNPLEIDAKGGEWYDAIAEASSTIRTYRTSEELAYLQTAEAYERRFAYELEYEPGSIPAADRGAFEAANRALEYHILDNPQLYRDASRQPYGYDGVIVKNVYDMTAAPVADDIAEYNPFTTVYVPFKPQQIKLLAGAKGYNPQQPRHPAGTAQGGRWVDNDGGHAVADAEPHQVFSTAQEGPLSDFVAAVKKHAPASTTVKTTKRWDKYGVKTVTVGTPGGGFAQAAIWRQKTTADDGTDGYLFSFVQHDVNLPESEQGSGLGGGIVGALAEGFRAIGVQVPIHFDTNPSFWSHMAERYPGVYQKGYNPQQPRHPAGSPQGGEWAGYTAAQKTAVYNYAEGWALGLNEALREDKTPGSPWTPAMIADLDSTMAPLGQPAKLYRCGPKAAYGDLKPGQRFLDKGYVSTTTDRSFAVGLLGITDDYDVVLEIEAPATARGVSVNAVLGEDSPFEDQFEIMLARDTVFEVVGSYDGGQWLGKVVKVRIVP